MNSLWRYGRQRRQFAIIGREIIAQTNKTGILNGVYNVYTRDVRTTCIVYMCTR